MLRTFDYPALLLNADGRPMSVAPLSTRSWQEAVEDVLAGKVMVLAQYDAYARSPSRAVQLPSVIATKSYVDLNRPAAFTRLNLFLTTGFRCAFCGIRRATQDLTFEHLIPRARGGQTGWENILPACVACNQRKGCRTPREANMKPLFKPRRPTVAEVNALAIRHAGRVTALHKSWLDFLYWDCDVEGPV